MRFAHFTRIALQASAASALMLAVAPLNAQDADQQERQRPQRADRVERAPDTPRVERAERAPRMERVERVRDADLGQSPGAYGRRWGGDAGQAAARPTYQRPQEQAPQPVAQDRPRWGGTPTAQAGGGRPQWRGGDRSVGQAQAQANADAQAAAAAARNDDSRWGRRDRDGSHDGRTTVGGRTWGNGQHSTQQPTWGRDSSHNRNGNYSHRNTSRYGQNGYNGHKSWNRDWRRDRSYDWHRYRTHNRAIYSLGRYYAPYRNYSYSRFSIGFRIGSLFYSNRYWINDPWRYRLPDVYGPYRWVRYYDDAVLVDIYSGEVVDVIYDFFW